MRRVALLIIAVAAGVAALILSSVNGDDARKHADRVTADRGAWALAREQVVNLDAGSFELITTSRACSEPVSTSCLSTIREHGSFTVDPASIDSERLIQRSPSKTDPDNTTQLYVRQLADGSSYFHDDLVESVCWIPNPGSMVDLFEAGFRASLDVLRTATVSEDPPPGTASEVHGRAVALTALRVLGLDESRDGQDGVTESTRQELLQKSVPVTIRINADGSPAGFELSGPAVAAALDPGSAIDVSTAYLAIAQNAAATFAITDLNRVPTIERPADALIAPAEANDVTACQANS